VVKQCKNDSKRTLMIGTQYAVRTCTNLHLVTVRCIVLKWSNIPCYLFSASACGVPSALLLSRPVVAPEKRSDECVDLVEGSASPTGTKWRCGGQGRAVWSWWRKSPHRDSCTEMATTIPFRIHGIDWKMNRTYSKITRCISSMERKSIVQRTNMGTILCNLL
jgi:hypothetical protein